MKPPARISRHFEVEELRGRLAEAEETLRAIRTGEVDAIVVSGPEGDRVYTLTGADHPYRLLVENMNEGAGTLTSDGIIVFANRRLAAMLRAPPELVAGSALTRWLGTPIPAHALGSSDESTGWTGETTLRALDGAIVPTSLALSPFRGNDQQVSFCLVATDLSTQKAIEQDLRLAARRLREAQDAGHLGSWEMEIARGRVTASDELGRILGIGPSRLGSLGALAERFHPEDRSQALDLLHGAVEGGGDVEAELRIVRPDGRVRWVFLRGRKIQTEAAAGDRLVLTAQDITDRKSAEREREESKLRLHEIERLQAVNEARRQMLFTLAHELNTPLTPITIQLELLARSESGQAHPEAMDRLRRNVQRLTRLVQDVLEVSRIDAGALQIHPERIDLAPIVAEAVASVQCSAQREGVAVEAQLEDGLWVLADAPRLQQVLLNFLTNAVKFTPHGGRVDVAGRRADGEVVIEVRDTGVGIRAEDIPRLFQPFTQLPQYAPGKPGGTGLGLYISKGLIHRHGGRIWSESAGPGRGATFGFALPWAAKPPAGPPSGGAEPGASADAPNGPRASSEAARAGERSRGPAQLPRALGARDAHTEDGAPKQP